MTWALLFALVGALALAPAATRAGAAAVTLDTANGPRVVGQPPGHVEVLFFSFPG